MGAERWLVDELHELLREQPFAVDVLRAVSALGKPQVLAVASVVLGIALLLRRRSRAAAFVVVATIGGWLVDNGLKELVGRERPMLDEPMAAAAGPSFPSGHAMTSAAAYGALLLLALPLVPQRWRPITVGTVVVLVAAIGVTRVALGVHWPTDVLGGWAFGVAWMALCGWLLRPIGPSALRDA